MHDKNVSFVKENLAKLDRSDFERALFQVDKRQSFVLALLKAIGFDEVKVEKDGDIESFFFDVYGKEVLLLKVDCLNSVVEGDSLEDIKKALYLVCAIEQELTAAIEYPHELRRKAIEAAVHDSGADIGFYKKVLNNWREY